MLGAVDVATPTRRRLCAICKQTAYHYCNLTRYNENICEMLSCNLSQVNTDLQIFTNAKLTSPEFATQVAILLIVRGLKSNVSMQAKQVTKTRHGSLR